MKRNTNLSEAEREKSKKGMGMLVCCMGIWLNAVNGTGCSFADTADITATIAERKT